MVKWTRHLTSIGALFMLLLHGSLVWAADTTEAKKGADTAADAQEIVNKSEKTFNNFVTDPNMSWFRDHVQDAKAIMIVPSLVKAGFILGGSGGSGVLLAHDPKTGSWSNPAFYTMGSVTFGLQIGGEAAEVIMMAMTDKGLDAMLSTKFQVGADASVAAGPVGSGAQAATADILQFSRAKGVFGGLTLEGAVVAVRDELNNAYYAKDDVRPINILVKREVKNPQAASLVGTVSKKVAGVE